MFYAVDWNHNANGLSIRHGAQGTFDDASKATLENEFGTTNEDEVIKQILEKGVLQETKVRVSHYIPHLFFPVLSNLCNNVLTLSLQTGSRENGR